MMRCRCLTLCGLIPAGFAGLCVMLATGMARADEPLPLVSAVERQPLQAATERLITALDMSGAPLSAEARERLHAAFKQASDRAAVRDIQMVLDELCIAGVEINAESRVKVAEGPATKELVQQGWRTFLVKVDNKAGITPTLRVTSPNAQPVYQQGKGARQKPSTDDKLITADQVPNRFLDIAVVDRQPMKRTLSGLPLEYRIVQLYSRERGQREAELAFDVGAGTQDLGFRNAVSMLFHCAAAKEIVLNILDTDDSPTTASFVIRDAQGRVYPNPARRLAPDFFFHNQIYRHDGETVTLPAGDYTLIAHRGPEYVSQPVELSVRDDNDPQAVHVKLARWIHPAQRNWFSGDHHVHAAGCAHYDSPTEGVGPEDMMRHILGEDLNVGCVLSWGPCWYEQKKHFEGAVSRLSTPQYLMRYDVEVSGFPSSHAGHLCLLRLTEDDYPGTTVIEEWPSWTLPVLAWGKAQGGVVGYSHSGWGLALPDVMPDGTRQFVGRPWGGAGNDWPGKAASTLPDYAMPPFDGIGANEYIVTVAHNQCDFISSVDTPAIWELNIWYHTLNCGMECRISGETDFPCIYGDKVGLGRIYVKLDEDQPLDFDAWVDGLKRGRSYCGDGMSHILDFKAGDVAVGEPGSSGRISHLDLKSPGTINVTFDAAALLEETPSAESQAIRTRRLDEKPYWHIERCRIGDTRKVPVEVIVNGKVAAQQEIVADGSIESLSFDVDIPHSGWVAVRILPSVHTNPIFVEVAGKPIRSSRRSAEWCRDAVDVCWKSKVGQIREGEREDAKAAYEAAKTIYANLVEQAVAD